MTVTALVLALSMLFTVQLEEGAVFGDNGECWEADGAVGIATVDGQCMTAADYDAIYSYENLASIPSAIPGSTQSIADEAGMTPDDQPASERELGEGVSPPHRFVDYVNYVHGLPIRLA